MHRGAYFASRDFVLEENFRAWEGMHVINSNSLARFQASATLARKLSDRFRRVNSLSRPALSSRLYSACIFFSSRVNNRPPLFPFAVVTRDHFDGIASTFTRKLIRTDGRNAQNRISLFSIWCTSHGTASASRLCDWGMCFPSIHSERFSIYDRPNVIYPPAVSA